MSQKRLAIRALFQMILACVLAWASCWVAVHFHSAWVGFYAYLIGFAFVVLAGLATDMESK